MNHNNNNADQLLLQTALKFPALSNVIGIELNHIGSPSWASYKEYIVCRPWTTQC